MFMAEENTASSLTTCNFISSLSGLKQNLQSGVETRLRVQKHAFACFLLPVAMYIVMAAQVGQPFRLAGYT